jgi:hypothetical protein
MDWPKNALSGEPVSTASAHHRSRPTADRSRWPKGVSGSVQDARRRSRNWFPGRRFRRIVPARIERQARRRPGWSGASVGWSCPSRPESWARSRPVRPWPEGCARRTSRRSKKTCQVGDGNRASRPKPSSIAISPFRSASLFRPHSRSTLGTGSRRGWAREPASTITYAGTHLGDLRTVAAGIDCGWIWPRFARNPAVRDRVASRR